MQHMKLLVCTLAISSQILNASFQGKENPDAESCKKLHKAMTFAYKNYATSRNGDHLGGIKIRPPFSSDNLMIKCEETHPQHESMNVVSFPNGDTHIFAKK